MLHHLFIQQLFAKHLCSVRSCTGNRVKEEGQDTAHIRCSLDPSQNFQLALWPIQRKGHWRPTISRRHLGDDGAWLPSSPPNPRGHAYAGALNSYRKMWETEGILAWLSSHPKGQAGLKSRTCPVMGKLPDSPSSCSPARPPSSLLCDAQEGFHPVSLLPLCSWKSLLSQRHCL